MLKQYEYTAFAIFFVLGTVSLFVVGFRSGEKHIQTQFDAYKSAQQILVQKMAIKAKEQEIENAKQTTAVSNSYQDAIARLNAALRLRGTKTNRRSAVSGVAVCPTGVNATRPAAPGFAEGDAFYGKAMKTELMLEAWQDWARRQKLPVQ